MGGAVKGQWSRAQKGRLGVVVSTNNKISPERFVENVFKDLTFAPDQIQTRND